MKNQKEEVKDVLVEKLAAEIIEGIANGVFEKQAEGEEEVAPKKKMSGAAKGALIGTGLGLAGAATSIATRKPGAKFARKAILGIQKSIGRDARIPSTLLKPTTDVLKELERDSLKEYVKKNKLGLAIAPVGVAADAGIGALIGRHSDKKKESKEANEMNEVIEKLAAYHDTTPEDISERLEKVAEFHEEATAKFASSQAIRADVEAYLSEVKTQLEEHLAKAQEEANQIWKQAQEEVTEFVKQASDEEEDAIAEEQAVLEVLEELGFDTEALLEETEGEEGEE